MAEENENGQAKTEEATSKRIGENRREGMIAKSYDLSTVFSLMATFIALKYLAPYIWKDLILVTRAALETEKAYEPFTIDMLRYNFLALIWLAAPNTLLLILIAAVVGVLVTGIQTKFNCSTKLLMPKWNMISPLAGIKRIFSLQNLFNLIKSIAKLGIVGPVAFFSMQAAFPRILNMIDLPIAHLLPLTSQLANELFWPIMKILFVIGILDYAWQKYSTQQRQMMSMQEVKDERKSVEGDEQTKMLIRSKGLERAMQRMYQAVRTADVVVTNPTHIAVALKYTMEPGKAPIVVAKGQGYIADRIRELAREHGIPVVERKPLARALFKACEVDQQIPFDLYAAVADLLAYVYKLKGRNPFSGRTRAKSKPA